MNKEKNYYRNIETERLLLRKITDEDAESLYRNVYNDFEYYKYYYQVPFKTFEDYKPLVEKYKEMYERGNHFRWCIVLKETNEIIGHIILHTKNLLDNNCKIGYIIGKNYTNKGYAKEAVTAIINFGLNEVKFHRIEAEIVAENVNSIKVIESVGMHFESIKEESYRIENTYYNQNIYTIINKNK